MKITSAKNVTITLPLLEGSYSIFIDNTNGLGTLTVVKPYINTKLT